MEYETVKQKDKISVKICQGSLWEEVKEKLRDTYVEEKKCPKNRLTVDINVKRQFRNATILSKVKDDSWMNRIKWVLSRRNKAQDSNPQSQDSKPTKVKQTENKDRSKEMDKARQDLFSQKSHNIIAQTKRRSLYHKNRDQISEETLKLKKSNNRSTPEGKTKESWKSGSFGGSSNAETVSGLKDLRQKGNNYEVQISNRVAVINLEYSDEEARERVKNQQITKDNRSKSKPATAKEKWNQSAIGKKMESCNEPTLETLKNMKSSIISLRFVKNEPKSRDKEKLKELKKKREEEKRSKWKDEEKVLIEHQDDESEDLEKTRQECINQAMKKRNDPELQKWTKEDKDSSSKEEDNTENVTENRTTSSSSTMNTPRLSADMKDWRCPADEQACGSSSCCFSGSSYSLEEECCCGCMNNKGTEVSSSSSSSSLEYLRSYSGNLIMCAQGKKPVLSQHIRYLSTGIKL